jgi:multicomponent Na+:H+ antiporter subunit D
MQNLAAIGPILIPLGTAFLLPFAAVISRRLIGILCLLAMTFTLAVLILAAGPVLMQGKILVYWLGGWQPQGSLALGINIAIDAWGLFIAFTIALVGFLVVLYSIVYMEEETGKEAYFILVMLLIAAMIGFSLTGDLFNQFVWLEILSFAAFALTGFHFQDHLALEGAFKYLITNSVASLFIAVALALLYGTTGALNLADAAGEFGANSAEMIALGLLFAGYATKTALVPWHFWLPDAYDAAPAPVTALFSGALSKVGIYAIARLLFTLTPIGFNYIVRSIFLGIAGITMFVGGFQMLRQDSIKRILAYSSISQMGYILMGLSIGSPLGLAAAAMHVFTHALSKTALFFGAGSIQLRSGIRRLSEGSRLIRRMPVTFVLMALAGLSLSGAPLFIGFVSKTMLEDAATGVGLLWLTGLAVLASVFTLAGIARLLWQVFFKGENETVLAGEGEARPLSIVAMLVPVVISLFVGIFPNGLLGEIGWPSAAALLQPGIYVNDVLKMEGKPANFFFNVQLAPSYLRLTAWIIPLIVIVVGLLLAYFSLPENEFRFWRFAPQKQLAVALRRWHSGYVLDYLLWITFSTSLLLILFIVFFIQVT